MIAVRIMLMVVMAAAGAVMVVMTGIIAYMILGNDFYIVQLGLDLFPNGCQVYFIKSFLLRLLCESEPLALFFVGQFIDTLNQFFGYHFSHLSFRTYALIIMIYSTRSKQ